MKKFIKIISFAIILILSITGCSISDHSAKYQRLSPGELKEGSTIKELADKIYNDNSNNSEGQCIVADDKTAEEVFYLNLDDVDEYAIEYSENDTYADNVAIVRAKEGKAYDVADSLTKRQKDLEEMFQDNKEEVRKIEKSKIIVKGNYVMLIAVQYADGAENTIKSFFNAK